MVHAVKGKGIERFNSWDGRQQVFSLDILLSPPAVLAVVYFGVKSTIVQWQVSNPFIEWTTLLKNYFSHVCYQNVLRGVLLCAAAFVSS